MTSTVLLPAIRHSAWVRTVASVLGDVEAATGAETVVLSVFDDVDFGDEVDAADAAARDRDLDERARARSGVQAAVDELTDAGVDPEVRGTAVTDDAAGAVLSAASEYDADRIYMYGRRRSPAGKAVFGSTLQDVLTDATVPVVVVPAAMQ